MAPMTFHVAMLLFPKATQLDFTGPYEVFARMPGARVSVVWTSRNPVVTDRGLALLPDATLHEVADCDLVFVPGGPGQVDLMDDTVVLDWLRRMAAGAQWVTSVCTGSLVLGAAGLLKGRRATCHWASLDQLALLGAVPVAERVVVDGRVITGAGVTSGIDFALTVAAAVAGADVARRIQLGIEYDPQAPFDAGSPRTAPADLVASVRDEMAGFIARRRAATEAAAKALGMGAGA
jgi:cyclohexyl-isocyanide hydratase